MIALTHARTRCTLQVVGARDEPIGVGRLPKPPFALQQPVHFPRRSPIDRLHYLAEINTLSICSTAFIIWKAVPLILAGDGMHGELLEITTFHRDAT